MRRLRWVAGLSVAAALLALWAAAGTPAAYAAGRGVAHAAEPSPHGSLAGSRAGVGRTPPGRTLPSPAVTEDALPPPPAVAETTAPASPTPRTERPNAARQTVLPGGGRVVNILPLGAGLLLTGLGLGFLALRLRR
ncbi:hypothetical protein [Streptomyces sp. NPDC052225]|uniref:hypothetical protein n=1 Tax=Streptomyces sp. NPDC052225 TaxID=3154949 RepID=UPI003431A777